MTAFGGTTTALGAAGAAASDGATDGARLTGAAGDAGAVGVASAAGAAGCAGRAGAAGAAGIGGRTAPGTAAGAGAGAEAGAAEVTTGVAADFAITDPGAGVAFGVVAPIGGRKGSEGEVRPPNPSGGVKGARNGCPACGFGVGKPTGAARASVFPFVLSVAASAGVAALAAAGASAFIGATAGAVTEADTEAVTEAVTGGGAGASAIKVVTVSNVCGAAFAGALSLSPPCSAGASSCVSEWNSECASSCDSPALTRGTSGLFSSRRRICNATSTSIELEWVFFSVTPYSGSKSRMSLGLTSSSRASSLIRIIDRALGANSSPRTVFWGMLSPRWLARKAYSQGGSPT